jgi:two-component system, LytTR family, response regulator
MIRTLLVDDEPINISNLQALLTRHCPAIEVVATASNAHDAQTHILNLKPDVVFLDIEMPEKNGFDLLRSLPEPTFEVVFVTAYDSYGIMAVKFSALDYLLKPIDINELKATIGKLEKSLEAKKQNARLGNLLSLLDNRQPDANVKIALPTQKETYLVPVRDIVRCESSNNYTTFFLTDGSTRLISRPLYEYDELLSAHGFIRCHQSHLVNKMHVRSILNEDSGYLILNHSTQKIPISRQKKSVVKSMLSL